MDFQRTTLIGIDQIMRERYPDSLPDYKEKRDETHKIIETFRTHTNATHRLEIKNVFDDWLWYREVPLDHVVELRQSVSEFAKSLDLPPFVHELNELLNQQAWEQTAAKEKIATQKIADMWAIVQAVANEQTIRENASEIQCPFCIGKLDYPNEPDYIRHTSGCIVMKARALVGATEQGRSHE